MMYERYNMYMLRIPYIPHRRKIGGMPVRERDVCPGCGKTLVNLYFKDGQWRCKQCMEKAGERDES